MIYACIDVGSTNTKVALIGVDSLKVIGTAKSATTIDTDVSIGVTNAVNELRQKHPYLDWASVHYLGCSSAAGGLRMVAMGLVTELTVQAAQWAALGAGAKLIKTYSYKITQKDQMAIGELNPDIILLAGGTNGGNEEVILHNAKLLAKSKYCGPIVIAGNKVVAEDVQAILEDSGKIAKVTENVLPELSQLNIRPAQEVIRQVFLERIIHAKGLEKVQELVDRPLIPTPAAVLEATRLLADGQAEEEGFGSVIVIDPGGATTDVHSAVSDVKTASNVKKIGLSEPYLKRTVEGDLGVRVNAVSIVEAAGLPRVKKNCALDGKLTDEMLMERIRFLSEHIEVVPNDELERKIDFGLVTTAIQLAIKRHAGRLEKMYSPEGELFLQHGKDCREVANVIATGGPLINCLSPVAALSECLVDKNDPLSLLPQEPRFYMDDRYILYSLGLLAQVHPTTAIKLAKKHLVPVGS